jgi:hypothetical protein
MIISVGSLGGLKGRICGLREDRRVNIPSAYKQRPTESTVSVDTLKQK